jgi:lysozyme
LLVLGVACEAPDDRSWAREPIGEVSQAGKLCPGADRVEGIDVSFYQGDVDWPAVKASGREFAIVRVSDGLGNPDSFFAKNWAGAKAAGLIRGTYQFFRPEEDAVAQAKMVLDGIGNKLEPGDLPPAIDVEAADGLSSSKVAAAVKTWIDAVEGKLGRKPIIYTGNSFWVNSVGNPSGYKDYPLWVAAYPYCYDSIKSGSYCPTIPDQWGAWTFWQYSDGQNTPNKGCTIDPPTVPGVGQSCDRSYFNGTLAQLQMLAGGSTAVEYKATYVSQTYPLASAPAVEATTGQVLTGSITFKNAGSKPWVPGQTFLAPMPRDQNSAFQAPSWPSAHRTGTVAQETPPGQEGTFSWDLEPSQAGDFSLFFGLVQEGVTWFADGPLGGGPADDLIQVKLSVKAGGGQGGAGGSGGSGAAGQGGGAAGSGVAGAGQGGAGQNQGGAGAAGLSGQGGHAGSGVGGAAGGGVGGSGHAGASGAAQAGAAQAGAGQETVIQTVAADDSSGGCGCRVAGNGGSPGGLGAAAAALLVAWRRRRGGRNKTNMDG